MEETLWWYAEVLQEPGNGAGDEEFVDWGAEEPDVIETGHCAKGNVDEADP